MYVDCELCVSYRYDPNNKYVLGFVLCILVPERYTIQPE